ncbi:MAG: FAD-binding oxidoreductase [Rhodospirillales bacterium]|nr:FAD-binding oxidoreductase [Rhodospirillales bacterium]
MADFDVVVIGAGIAGASAAYELAATRRVLVVERESQPGYHATGRSAAVFAESYGNPIIRAITAASRAFYEAPPSGFADAPLWRPRGALIIGRADQRPALERLHAEVSALVAGARLVDAAEALRLVPILKPDYVAGGMLDPAAMELDVNAIHQGYLRGLRRRGGAVVLDAEVLGIERSGGLWRVTTRAGAFAAPVVVNATGAWADAVAEMAGARPLGLRPLRRTAVVFDPPFGVAVDGWPMVIDADEEFYFKPDAGRLLASPADETPSAPCDAQPDEIDVATALARFEEATGVEVRRIGHKWAGLRTFMPDRSPAVGFDPAVEGFFWLAGQGGYGIQTAPALARIAAALLRGEALPPDVAALGVTAADLAPRRAM